MTDCDRPSRARSSMSTRSCRDGGMARASGMRPVKQDHRARPASITVGPPMRSATKPAGTWMPLWYGQIRAAEGGITSGRQQPPSNDQAKVATCPKR